YTDFGSAEALRVVLERVFLHAGTWSSFRGEVWGAPVDPRSADYDAHSFVTFLQDHDQVGNRAAGDRIHHGLSPGAHAAASALILLGPGTPMLFQGEEWAASTPFTYFTAHDDELGAAVTAGRVEEFSAMGWAEQVPDPQLRSTFEASILRWQEREQAGHAEMLEWYRTLIGLRREHADLHDPSLEAISVEVLAEETVLLRRGALAVFVHRGPGPGAQVLLAVPAAQQLVGEEIGEDTGCGAAVQGGQHRHLAVVEPVHQHHEAQRVVMMGQTVHPGDVRGGDVVDHRAVAGGVDGGEVLEQGVEAVERGLVHLVAAAHHLVLGQRRDLGGAVAATVVLPVDPQHLEALGHRLDLPQEVLCREPSLAERIGEGVRGRHDRDAPVGELPDQPGHQQGVPRVVELELVDAHQHGLAQQVDRPLEPERADQVGVLHEGAVHPVALDGVEQGR